LPVVL